MADKTTTVAQLRDQVAQFVKERDWGQFHTPKNLSMDIAIEASELMEKFLWVDSKDSAKELETNRAEIEEEFADVLMALFCFSNACGINVSKALEDKLALTAKRYPVEKAKGHSTKYTKL